ncbi:hypothetical protein RD1_3712 [Roseobacter denitrificans OCh 114]|uniref:Uncharacterized protein n=1 Tax=Roseobacter denitrificans (strain ATCC 33942 / OCh 114) TaxID=375451 RepID=Q162A9_ROSDO|nr:hypothetical protein RD1_3712 [Roseobacter denitrificans OCh 114]
MHSADLASAIVEQQDGGWRITPKIRHDLTFRHF